MLELRERPSDKYWLGNFRPISQNPKINLNSFYNG